METFLFFTIFSAVLILNTLLVEAGAAYTLVNLISDASGGESIGNYGVRLAKSVFGDKSAFYMIENNKCKTIELFHNEYIEICSSVSQRLRYVNRQNSINVHAFKRFNIPKNGWVECARVSPQINGKIITYERVVFCSGAPRNDLSLVYSGNKNEKDLRVGPTYAEWVKKCYVKDCMRLTYKELGYKMGKKLIGK
ncbi:hypothetical protein PIROE2DRAFT_64892 [Piromyces sp. E2]|nr:hypothetical protein PIROE2DRAFT_64892 [Piromyces sp. E2]|eukprot:OUM57633.1 hypothetical protein PIROE2DRAFT_64892 [Piromyces sp. E2]